MSMKSLNLLGLDITWPEGILNVRSSTTSILNDTKFLSLTVSPSATDCRIISTAASSIGYITIIGTFVFFDTAFDNSRMFIIDLICIYVANLSFYSLRNIVNHRFFYILKIFCPAKLAAPVLLHNKICEELFVITQLIIILLIEGRPVNKAYYISILLNIA